MVSELNANFQQNVIQAGQPAHCMYNKAYRPNAHLLYIVMHYNGNIMVVMVLYNFTLLFQPLEQTLITQNPNLCGTTI